MQLVLSLFLWFAVVQTTLHPSHPSDVHSFLAKNLLLEFVRMVRISLFILRSVAIEGGDYPLLLSGRMLVVVEHSSPSRKIRVFFYESDQDAVPEPCTATTNVHFLECILCCPVHGSGNIKTSFSSYRHLNGFFEGH